MSSAQNVRDLAQSVRAPLAGSGLPAPFVRAPRVFAARSTAPPAFYYGAPVGGAAKRAVDFAFAAVALIMLAPVLLIIAFLIRAESPGPVFFKQRRGGHAGRAFFVYKFRSMTVTDDNARMNTQTARGDARVTRVGAVIRKTSLDELPQLINVLLGEMSIVGPRPHPLAIDHECSLVEPDYWRRHHARPGITGLAQVSGSRGPLNSPEDIKNRVRLDVAYLNEWSLALDFWIIARTALTVLNDQNAY